MHPTGSVHCVGCVRRRRRQPTVASNMIGSEQPLRAQGRSYNGISATDDTPASRLTPHASRLTPHASRLTPHSALSTQTSPYRTDSPSHRCTNGVTCSG